jgi:hypothetical protein
MSSPQLSLKLWKGVALLLGGGLLTSLIVLYTLAEFHEELSEAWLRTIDLIVANTIHGHASPIMTQMMLVLTFIGSVQVVIPVVTVVALWRWLKHCGRDAFLISYGRRWFGSSEYWAEALFSSSPTQCTLGLVT